ncbi:hypothetical protein ACWEYS_13240 [Staphylococcus xylosus]|uniref:hypothetical protein n=1 Tax=Staphylococcus xylosus TaxID=1288 RepID=UPI000853D1F3|nr:hypothetical protein [Staphylococcus xylosus]OEK81629.1 hypothetical protein AST16_01305 [Staphylococcus xylosus]
MDNKSGKIFSLELNVGSFLGAIIAMFIYFLNSQQDIKSLVSIALTFAFPIYLLKVSRLYEQVECNRDNFLKEILFPKLSKNDVKIYSITICKYLVLIIVFILTALLWNLGLQNDNNNLIAKVFCCYSVLALFIASSLLLMDLVFDFLIGAFLIAQKNLIRGE